jgi:biotin carboxyl carrier protein
MCYGPKIDFLFTRSSFSDANAVTVKAEMSGVVWKTATESGKTYKAGETVTILEAMKMEIPCKAVQGFTVRSVPMQPGDRVNPGDVLVAGVMS